MNNAVIYQCPYCGKKSEWESTIGMHIRTCPKRSENDSCTTKVIIRRGKIKKEIDGGNRVVKAGS